MSDPTSDHRAPLATDARDRLENAVEQVGALLARHRALETWTHNQAVRQREVLESLVRRQNLAELQLRIRTLHPADLAFVLQSLDGADRALVWEQVGPAQAALVLPELPGAVREALVASTPRASLVACLAAMDASDLAYVADAVPADVLDDVYRERAAGDRSWIEKTAAYPEGTVGRLMTQDYVAVPESSRVEDAIRQIRARGELSRRLDALFLVDGRNVLRAIVPLRALLLHDGARPLAELATPHPTAFRPEDTAEGAVDAFARYDLVCAPVADERGKLLGAVTVDAMIDFQSERTTKDIQMMGGLEALDAPYDQVSFWAMVRKRGGWLSALFLGEMLTATAMGHYEEEIARAVVLALFVPLIISSGGNSGSQAASLIIRALALRELRLRDWLRVMKRELLSGVTLGAGLGVIGFVRIILWQWLGFTDYGPHMTRIAATVWLSLIGVVGFGTLAGSMLPFLLRRLGFDPATSSAPFVATLVDVTGLVIYFQVAGFVLRGALH